MEMTFAGPLFIDTESDSVTSQERIADAVIPSTEASSTAFSETDASFGEGVAIDALANPNVEQAETFPQDSRRSPAPSVDQANGAIPISDSLTPSLHPTVEVPPSARIPTVQHTTMEGVMDESSNVDDRQHTSGALAPIPFFPTMEPPQEQGSSAYEVGQEQSLVCTYTSTANGTTADIHDKQKETHTADQEQKVIPTDPNIFTDKLISSEDTLMSSEPALSDFSLRTSQPAPPSNSIATQAQDQIAEPVEDVLIDFAALHPAAPTMREVATDCALASDIVFEASANLLQLDPVDQILDTLVNMTSPAAPVLDEVVETHSVTALQDLAGISFEPLQSSPDQAAPNDVAPQPQGDVPSTDEPMDSCRPPLTQPSTSSQSHTPTAQSPVSPADKEADSTEKVDLQQSSSPAPSSQPHAEEYPSSSPLDGQYEITSRLPNQKIMLPLPELPPSTSPPSSSPDLGFFPSSSPQSSSPPFPYDAADALVEKTRPPYDDEQIQDDDFLNKLEDYGKRKSEVDMESSPPKRARVDALVPPAPPATKRPTVALQKLQLKKLATPFRSPVVDPSKATSRTGLPSSNRTKQFKVPALPARRTQTKSEDNTNKPDALPQPHSTELLTTPNASHEPKLDPKILHRTSRAALQFKSPLAAGTASTQRSNVRLTPTVQALERKLQILKRAVKVKQGNEEEELTDLVAKWKEAAREVAWLVWEIYKERGEEASGVGGAKTESWGWQGSSATASSAGSWGWGDDEKPEGGQGEDGEETGSAHVESRPEEDGDGEDGEARDNMGIMLRTLGIDPLSLGWDAEQECFVDE